MIINFVHILCCHQESGYKFQGFHSYHVQIIRLKTFMTRLTTLKKARTTYIYDYEDD